MVYQIKIKNILNRSCIRERSKDGLQKLGEKKTSNSIHAAKCNHFELAHQLTCRCEATNNNDTHYPFIEQRE